MGEAQGGGFLGPFQAFRVLEQPDSYKDMTKDDFMERHRAWCCSTVPEQALCGISRVWVFSLARRQGIATRMLDTVRYVTLDLTVPLQSRFRCWNECLPATADYPNHQF